MYYNQTRKLYDYGEGGWSTNSAYVINDGFVYLPLPYIYALIDTGHKSWHHPREFHLFGDDFNNKILDRLIVKYIILLLYILIMSKINKKNAKMHNEIRK